MCWLERDAARQDRIRLWEHRAEVAMSSLSAGTSAYLSTVWVPETLDFGTRLLGFALIWSAVALLFVGLLRSVVNREIRRRIPAV